MKDEEQGAGSRNDARSGAERVPIMLTITSGCVIDTFRFYVSKVQLADGLRFVAEGQDDYVRQARLRHIFSNLIARSIDTSDK